LSWAYDGKLHTILVEVRHQTKIIQGCAFICTRLVDGLTDQMPELLSGLKDIIGPVFFRVMKGKHKE
jgi:hypothetical protein